jgi:hypothetical protein
MKFSYICLFFFLIPFAAGADSGKPKFTKHYAESIFKATDKGFFGVEMLLKDKEPKTGVSTLKLIIHDASDRDVAGAEITITPWMPEMGHGVSQKPTVTERGGGLYDVEDLIFIMGGHWELRVKVKKDGIEDSVVFDFPEVKAVHEHAMQAPAPSDVDTSSARSSDRKTYIVSYTIEPSPAPLNRIHQWKLNVKNQSGQPVKGARIIVSGDMPEHGHGLPTQPEVTKEVEDGLYLVEGMKFQMPGWWVVTFQISAAEGQDSVTFNLFVK